jgi:F0F1-type ATP synthase membrane subunit b/b'
MYYNQTDDILLNDTEHMDFAVNVFRLVVMATFVPVLVYNVCGMCRDHQTDDIAAQLDAYKEMLSDSHNNLICLQKELEDTEELVDDIEEKYKDCRRAAQRFIDTYPDSEVSVSKRKRME